MNEFYKKEASLPELVINGQTPLNIEASCNALMLKTIENWNCRELKHKAEPNTFEMEGTQVFTIDYQGEADRYWPDSAANAIAESLIRDVLYNNGICTLKTLDPTLYKISFKVMALLEEEYLLVLPYPTESGNIAGLVVVCVNNYLK